MNKKALVMLLIIPIPMIPLTSNGLLIVVTFPSLVYDVKQLAYIDDTIVSIVPFGADPHEYQLTPSDIDLLKKADIIISTGHTSFEKDIRLRVESREFNGVLIEINSLEGIVIKDNPVTHQPNYHMVIYDPYNYMVFIRYLGDVMSSLRPVLSQYYKTRVGDVLSRVEGIVENSPKLNNCIAVADTPLTQYAVSWTGISIQYLVVKEHGMPASPKDIENIAYSLEKGFIDIVVVTEPISSKASSLLVELANKYDVPIVYVKSPLINKSIVDKLDYIASQISSLEINAPQSIETHSVSRQYYMYPLTSILVFSMIALTLYIIYRSGR